MGQDANGGSATTSRLRPGFAAAGLGAVSALAVLAATTMLQDPPVLSLVETAESRYVRPGETVTVRLRVSGLAGRDVNSVLALLHFDSSRLGDPKTVAASPDGPWKDGLPIGPTYDGDKIDYALGLLGGHTSEDAEIAILTFTAGGPDGAAAVGFRPDEPPGFTKFVTWPDLQNLLPDKQDPGPIVVDGTPPVVTVTYPPHGAALLTGKSHTIEWTTLDANPGTVTIEYSLASASGPWTALAQDIPDTGSHPWNALPNTESDTCFIRIIATDKAGNVGAGTSGQFAIVKVLPPVAAGLGPKTDHSIQANWDSNGNLQGTDYKAQCFEGTGFGGMPVFDTGYFADLLSYDFTSLDPDTQYSFRVRARSLDQSRESVWIDLGSTYTHAQTPGDITFHLTSMVGDRLDPDGPGPTSVGVDTLDTRNNPDTTRYAIQIGTDPDAAWFALDDATAQPDDYVPNSAGPQWRTLAQWRVARLCGLLPNTDHTFGAAARNALEETTDTIIVGLFRTNKAGDINRSGLATALDLALVRWAILRAPATFYWPCDANGDRQIGDLDRVTVRAQILNPED